MNPKTKSMGLSFAFYAKSMGSMMKRDDTKPDCPSSIMSPLSSHKFQSSTMLYPFLGLQESLSSTESTWLKFGAAHRQIPEAE
jgi:hypothetical protein